MQGERFLLLAEQEQLLAPVVLAQMRRILANQRRPATGEAVARLLVDRHYLTVEQARRIIAVGGGPVSPLAPRLDEARALSKVAPRPTPSGQSDDLLLAPEETAAAAERNTAVGNPSAVATQRPIPPTAPSHAPLIPSEAELVELADSLRSWMEMPGTLDWTTPPSPIFEQRGWQISPTAIYVGLAGVLLLFTLIFFVSLIRYLAG